MVFINKLADHSHHLDLRVDDELVCKNLKLPADATVEGLTVNHIQGLSDGLGNLTIDETALLTSVQSQIDSKADASDVYTKISGEKMFQQKCLGFKWSLRYGSTTLVLRQYYLSTTVWKVKIYSGTDNKKTTKRQLELHIMYLKLS